MELQLNDEQQMLRDSARRWVSERGRAPDGGPPGRGSRWREMAGMGWLAMTFAERDGGLGQGLAEACVLAEALGAGPVAEPYLEAIVIAGGMLGRDAGDVLRERWLPAIGEGRALVAPALTDRGGGHGLMPVSTWARADGDAWVIDGDKPIVPAGDAADAWLVTARVDTAAGAELACFLVERGTAGVTARGFDTVDGGRACALQLRGVRLPEAARLGGATLASVSGVVDEALVVTCAESVGAMDAALAATVEYTRTRVQFGRPLAANQVLRHRMADLSVLCEEARSMTLGAVLALADAQRDGDARLRARAAAAARAKVGAAARRVAEEAIQLHGGMGVTEELAVGPYLRRQLALDALLGPAEWHLRRHAAMRSESEATR
jgi:hypothetical protein